MAEGISFSSEFGSDDEASKEKKEKNKRRVGRHAVGFHGAPQPWAEKIEKVGGDEPVESRKAGLFLRPIKPDLEIPKRQAHEKEPEKNPEAEAAMPAEHARFDHEQNLRRTTPAELAELAARDARAEMFALHLLEQHAEKSDEDDEEEDKKKKQQQAALKQVDPKLGQPEEAKIEEPAEAAESPDSRHTDEKQADQPNGHDPAAGNERELVEEARAEAEPVREEFEDIMAQAMPAEFAVSASGDKLSNEAVPDEPAVQNAAEAPALESIEFPAPQQTPVSHETPAFQPTAQERPSDDEAFQNIIENEYGARPGGASWHEAEPGEPPVSDTGEGADFPPPPYRPTAEGGAWENAGWPRPNGMRMPSGVAMDALTLGGLAALESRQRFNNLRHTMTEAALFGGELLLAAGLVGEHISRKREARKLKRALKRQGAAIHQTNQALQQHQHANQATKPNYNAPQPGIPAQGVIAEQLSKSAMKPQAGEHAPIKHAVEAGALGVVAAGELVRRAGNNRESPQTLDHRELAHQLRSSREFGKAIKENPELRSAAEAAGVPAAELNRMESGEQREPAGVQAEAPGTERNFEKLQDPLADKSAKAVQSSGGVDAAIAGLLPAHIQKNDTNDDWPDIRLDELPKDKTRRKSRLANPWFYAIVFIILVLILVAVYAVKTVAADFA